MGDILTYADICWSTISINKKVWRYFLKLQQIHKLELFDTDYEQKKKETFNKEIEIEGKKF